jgi:hypothetical protein
MILDNEDVQNRVKQINRGLYVTVEQCKHGLYYSIRHKDDRTGLDRKVFDLLDDSDVPISLDIQALLRLQFGIDWEKLDKFKEPDALAKSYIEEQKKEKARRELEQQGLAMDIMRDAGTKRMMEEFRSKIPKEVWKQHETNKKIEQENKKFKIYI